MLQRLAEVREVGRSLVWKMPTTPFDIVIFLAMDGATVRWFMVILSTYNPMIKIQIIVGSFPAACADTWDDIRRPCQSKPANILLKDELMKIIHLGLPRFRDVSEPCLGQLLANPG